jgi:hypothetical protein
MNDNISPTNSSIPNLADDGKASSSKSDVLYVILTRISRGFCISGQKFEIQFVATVMAIFV